VTFATAIIDPPWPYRVPRQTADGDDSRQSGYSGQQYEPMSLPALAALPIGDIVSDLVLVWTTGPMLPAAAHLIAAWGFDWITAIYWVKTSKTGVQATLFNEPSQVVYKPHMGVGYWFRGDVEPVAVGKRRGTPSYRTGRRAAFLAPVAGHSRKPPYLHELVEQHFPGPYLEVFARERRPGWTCIGDAIDGRDVATALCDP
jgi:N6-adenosine-specific RNA methylase IME4